MDSLIDIQSKERNPYLSELLYFARNPHVAGMATEDNRVILQPTLYGKPRDSVYKNEMARLLLKSYTPKSSLNNLQVSQFSGTPYESDKVNAMRSILARGLSGDPSANLDFSQIAELGKLRTLGGLLGGF